MPSKRRMAEVGAAAAPRLSRLPDELWGKIFRDVAHHEDADLAALRLVNKHCAKMYAHRQYGLVVRRMFRRKRQWHIEECLLKAHSIQATASALQALKERDRSHCDGELRGELKMERFIWELGTNALGCADPIPFLKACIVTLSALGY